MRCSALLSTFCIVGLAVAGCQKPVYFPTASHPAMAKEAGAFQAYEIGPKANSRFFTFTNADGRIDRIGYAYDGARSPQQIVPLDHIDHNSTRHLVIILDGFGYDVVKEFYDQGGLRYCYPPSRVIAPYPTLTDLSLEDVLGYIPCPGYEAEYFDRTKGELEGGSGAYLEGRNEPYNRLLGYRADLILDAFGYLSPWAVFNKEINDCKRKFDKNDSPEMMAYFVSSAGVGTIQGKEGQRRCLQRVEQMVNQLMWESHGLLKVTILADHGHSYTHSTRIPLEQYIEKHNWRLSERLDKPRDVVYVRFGLETYAAFNTRQKPELAADLIAADGVELASYVEKDTVVVLGKNGGKAVIRHKGGDGYQYEPVSGDPLKLLPILQTLKPDAEGFYNHDDLFKATYAHDYPVPLERLWRAHYSLVKNPADVVISLEDRFYSGSRTFDRFVNIASTHGSLNRNNSTTFIMTNIAPLPPAMESYQVPAAMKHVLGRDFPLKK